MAVNEVVLERVARAMAALDEDGRGVVPDWTTYKASARAAILSMQAFMQKQIRPEAPPTETFTRKQLREAVAKRVQDIEFAKQTIGEAMKRDAKRHALNLRQCAIFAADVGKHIAQSMTDAADFLDPAEGQLCEDEGCDHYGTPHVCNPAPSTHVASQMMPKEPTLEILRAFDIAAERMDQQENAPIHQYRREVYLTMLEIAATTESQP